MKYIVILGDGMADEPLAALNGKTPLEAAATPMLDELAGISELGLAKTIPEGMKPGSDTANLAVLGYNPAKYYSGRSPLEALSIGVPMKDSDIAVRCNLVTLSEEEAYEDKIIRDHSSGEISTKEAAELIEAVKKEFENDRYQFYIGTSYRHCLIINHGSVMELSQPHDILERRIGDYLPQDKILCDMMKRSFAILNQHPVNLEREKRGLNKANSLWFWGAGTKPALSSFEKKTGLRGAMISAVDLLKGIAVGAGMKVIIVDGADGTLHTNYEGKAKAAVDVLLKEGYDFVYVHVEAPDEMGHQGSMERKIKAIENLDSRVIRPVVQAMNQSGVDYRLLVLPDHPTPIWCRTHTRDPIPYLLYDNTKPVTEKKTGIRYHEKSAAESGIIIQEGYCLMDRFLGKRQ